METHAVMWFCVFAIDSRGFLEERLRMQELSEEGAGMWWEDESSWIGNLRLRCSPRYIPHSSPDQEISVSSGWKSCLVEWKNQRYYLLKIQVFLLSSIISLFSSTNIGCLQAGHCVRCWGASREPHTQSLLSEINIPLPWSGVTLKGFLKKNWDIIDI